MQKIMFLKNKSIFVKFVFSMATHYAILKSGVYLQNTHISAATHPRTLNLVSN